MTNYERITQSPDTLAEFLRDANLDCADCPIQYYCIEGDDCAETLTKWLNEPEESEGTE